MKIGSKARGVVTSFRDMVAQRRMSNPSPQGYGVGGIQRPILNSGTVMPNLFLPLDVQCSMLDVRRFRADL